MEMHISFIDDNIRILMWNIFFFSIHIEISVKKLSSAKQFVTYLKTQLEK